MDPLATGLVACYRFDDNFNDSSGNGNTLTSFRDPTYGPGVLGQALYDGRGQSGTLAGTLPLGATSPFTISAWFLSPDLDPTVRAGGFVSLSRGSGTGGAAATMQLLSGDTGHGIDFRVGFQETISPLDLDPNDWHMATLVYPSTGLGRCYSDGVQFGIVGRQNPSGILAPKTFVETNQDIATPIDLFMVWNRELSNLEIQMLFNGGRGRDPSMIPEIVNTRYLALPGVRSFAALPGARGWLAGAP